MASFDDIPAEVVDIICMHLRDNYSDSNSVSYDPRSRDGLHGLCLSSKKHYNVVQPHLYFHINTADIKVGALLQTIAILNPSLAHLIREIEIHEYSWLNVTKRDLDNIRDHFHVTSRTISSRVQNISHGNSVSLVQCCFEILFLCVPNLKRIELTLSECGLNFDFFDALRLSYQGRHSFPKADSLSFRYGLNQRGFALHTAFPLLKMTNSTRLSIYMSNRFRIESLWVFPKLRDLRLQYSALDYGELSLLLKCFPNLEFFQYETADYLVTRKKAEVVASKLFSRALMEVKRSLRTLILNQCERIESWDDEKEGSIESLREFTALEHLTIWQGDLADKRDIWNIGEEQLHDKTLGITLPLSSMESFVQKLPCSLKSLRILASNELLQFELMRLAYLASQWVPNLRVLEVDYRYGGNVTEAFEKTYVDLKLVKRYGFAWHSP